jgi:hypothetical protein
MNFRPNANPPPEEPSQQPPTPPPQPELSIRHEQLSLRFVKGNEPDAHYSLVHQNQYGISFICQLSQGNLTNLLTIDPSKLSALQSLLEPIKNLIDVFYSPSEFRSTRRTIDQLAKVNAFFIDLDRKLFKNTPENQPYNWTNQINRIAAIDIIFRFVESRKLPLPRLIVWTGNGYHLYWLLENESHHCLPYWSLLQRDLIELLRPIGADPACCDPTRILRLAGSLHSNRRPVEFYECLSIKSRWKLRELYPIIYSAYKDFIAIPKNPHQAEQINQRARTRKILRPNPGWKNISSFYTVTLDDLVRIAECHPNRQIPEGFRDEWLFVCSISLSYVCCDPFSLAQEILNYGTTYTSLTRKQIMSYTSTVRKRANRYYQELKAYQNGISEHEPPNYRYKLTVREILFRLEPIIPAPLYSDLRAIVPSRLKKERKYQQNHNPDPKLKRNQRKKGKSAERRALAAYACHLHNRGLNPRQIALELGVDRSTIYRWLKL